MVCWKPISAESGENQERSSDYNKYIAKDIQQRMRVNKNWLSFSHPRPTVIGVSRCLSPLLLQFMNPRFFQILYFNNEEISADRRWFVLGQNLCGGNFVIRTPFDMDNINDFHATSITEEQLFAILKARLSRKSDMEWIYSLQVSRDGTFFSLILFI